MEPWRFAIGKSHCWIWLILIIIPLSACAPVPPPATPPTSYTGPIAEEPFSQNGDYWIYQSVTQVRLKSTKLFEQIGFPLWIGKTWNYEGGAILRGQPQTTKASRIPTKIECYTTSFTEVTVPAGTFKAFKCECKCAILSLQYDPSCGEWTIWYAPDIRNIVKRETESTESSIELIDYNGRRRPPATKTPPQKNLLNTRGE